MFEKAARLKLRFSTPTGLLTTEDLWDLPLENGRANLNDIARAVSKQIKETQEESFVSPRSSVNTELDLQLDILKHVIKVRQDEAQSKLLAKQKREQRQKILALIDQKKEDALSAKSADELEKLLSELGE